MERQIAYRFIEKIAYEFSNQSESHGAVNVCGVRFYLNVRMPISIAFNENRTEPFNLGFFLSFIARTLRVENTEIDPVQLRNAKQYRNRFEKICAKMAHFRLHEIDQAECKKNSKKNHK